MEQQYFIERWKMTSENIQDIECLDCNKNKCECVLGVPNTQTKDIDIKIGSLTDEDMELINRFSNLYQAELPQFKVDTPVTRVMLESSKAVRRMLMKLLPNLISKAEEDTVRKFAKHIQEEKDIQSHARVLWNKDVETYLTKEVK